ncbi:AzlC family ABC transporter permease [Aquihabitans daechungensis]|uniref:AzlC family ABC transporter permease n=1 Tax=Aquihabitans daechungensis TaxID=1052257 RepID=UPI003BA3A462
MDEAPSDPAVAAVAPAPGEVARIAIPVGLGLFPLGLALGALVVHAGLDWWWATVFSSIVYAGSLEFLLVGMAVAGVPLAQVALSTLLVNSRHVFYALSFPLHNVDSKLAKAYATFALTDEAYAVTTSPHAQRWTSKQIIGVQVFFQLSWVGGATIGALAGSVLPLDRLEGLGFALTALFVVLAIEAYRERPDRVSAVVAVACALVALALSREHMLPIAFAGFTAVQVIRARLDPIEVPA